jgi:hypothetical protein
LKLNETGRSVPSSLRTWRAQAGGSMFMVSMAASCPIDGSERGTYPTVKPR